MRRIGVLGLARRGESKSLTRFVQGLQEWAGPKAATSDRHPLGGGAMPSAFRTPAAELFAASAGRYRHSLAPVAGVAGSEPPRHPIVFVALVPIRSAPVSSRAWRDRAATPPAFFFLPRSSTESEEWPELLKEICPRHDAYAPS